MTRDNSFAHLVTTPDLNAATVGAIENAVNEDAPDGPRHVVERVRDILSEAEQRRQQLTAHPLCRVCGVELDPSQRRSEHKDRICKPCNAAYWRAHRGRKPEYQAWIDMVRRCTQPARADWPDYGGRGITVCEQWRDDFEAFIADVGSRPGPGYSIERLDNSKGYEPGNCKWATRTEQLRNRRCTRLITINGESRTLPEWSRLLGIPKTTIDRRIEMGWTGDEILAGHRVGKAPKRSAQHPGLGSSPRGGGRT